MSKSGKKDGQNSSEFTLEVSNKMGVHARPAAMIVRIASRFEGEIWITKEDERVNAKEHYGDYDASRRKGNSSQVRSLGNRRRSAQEGDDRTFCIQVSRRMKKIRHTCSIFFDSEINSETLSS